MGSQHKKKKHKHKRRPREPETSSIAGRVVDRAKVARAQRASETNFANLFPITSAPVSAMPPTVLVASVSPSSTPSTPPQPSGDAAARPQLAREGHSPTPTGPDDPQMNKILKYLVSNEGDKIPPLPVGPSPSDEQSNGTLPIDGSEDVEEILRFLGPPQQIVRDGELLTDAAFTLEMVAYVRHQGEAHERFFARPWPSPIFAALLRRFLQYEEIEGIPG